MDRKFLSRLTELEKRIKELEEKQAPAAIYEFISGILHDGRLHVRSFKKNGEQINDNPYIVTVSKHEKGIEAFKKPQDLVIDTRIYYTTSSAPKEAPYFGKESFLHDQEGIIQEDENEGVIWNETKTY